MAECECIQGCPFFNDKMKDTEGLGAMYRKKYCLGDNTDCARHMVFKALGKSSVPLDLYPNQLEKAQNIIAGK